jgi:predicted nucleotidyltransferase
MDPTPYSVLNEVLDELVTRISEALGNKLIGVYLQGSFALGDFDEHSDVDFVVVLEDELSPPEVETLQKMHPRIYDLGPEWAKHLEGSYFPLSILQDFERRNEYLWYLDHGATSIIRSDHCNSLLVRWIVRERGVILAGPPPKEIIEPIPQEMLRQEMYDVIMTWGKQILEDPSRWSNRFYQGFIVLNYARMLHDLHRGHPGTKHEGAEWAKLNLDPSWSLLIDRSWSCRPDPASKVKEPADPDDYRRTLAFLEHVMNESQRFMESDSA